MGYNDVLMTCDFCGNREKFGKIRQECLRPLTKDEVEEFKKKGKVPSLLEYAMRCDECKGKGVLTTLDGYTIDTTPIETIPKEKFWDVACDREAGIYRARILSSKRRKK